MPPLLFDQETHLDPACGSPVSTSSPPSPQQLLSPPSQLLRHYIPVLTRSIPPDSSNENVLPVKHATFRRPVGVSLNVNALPEIYGEDDGNLHDSELLMQLSPASVTQLGISAASPTSLSTLSALRRYLPSNFDVVDALHYDASSGDDFRMYEFKVRRCMRGRSHDWTQCPFAHPGEKARRRDPCRYHYSGTACPDYKKGSCKKADACDLAHGVFETWLHPTRYRTQPCKDGRGCQRRVCFFAHTPDQLRVVSPTASSPSSSPSASFLCANSMESPLEVSELCGPSPAPMTPCMPLSSSLSESPPIASSEYPGLANTGISTASSLSQRSCAFDLFPHTSASRRSPCQSPKDVSLQSSISSFLLPTSTSMGFGQSLQSNNIHACIPTYNSMFADMKHGSVSLLTPSLSNGAKFAVTSPPSPLSVAGHTSNNVEELVGLLKQVGLARDEELVWQDGGRSSMLPERLSVVGSACNASARAAYTSPRDTQGMIFNGGFFDDEEDRSEPRLERVESGRGLRAQIFESLISSASASGN